MSDWRLTVMWFRSCWRFTTYKGRTKSAPYRVVRVGPLCLTWIDESKRKEWDFDTGKWTLDDGA